MVKRTVHNRLDILKKIVVLNLPPVLGVFLFDWQIRELITVYWFEMSLFYVLATLNTMIQWHYMWFLYILSWVPATAFSVLVYGVLMILVDLPNEPSNASLNSIFNTSEFVSMLILLSLSFVILNWRKLKVDRGERVLAESVLQLVMISFGLMIGILPLILIRTLSIFETDIILLLLVKMLFDYAFYLGFIKPIRKKVGK